MTATYDKQKLSEAVYEYMDSVDFENHYISFGEWEAARGGIHTEEMFDEWSDELEKDAEIELAKYLSVDELAF